MRKIEGARYVLKNIRWEAGYGIYEHISLEYVHEGLWIASQWVEREREPLGVLLRWLGREGRRG
ncbi:MAG: hypothetical protein ACRDRL_16760 [Sciscionella sp.]